MRKNELSIKTTEISRGTHWKNIYTNLPFPEIKPSNTQDPKDILIKLQTEFDKDIFTKQLNQELGSIFKTAISSSDYNQEEIADLLDIHPSALSRKLNGETRFRVEEISILCIFFKIRLD